MSIKISLTYELYVYTSISHIYRGVYIRVKYTLHFYMHIESE